MEPSSPTTRRQDRGTAPQTKVPSPATPTSSCPHARSTIVTRSSSGDRCQATPDLGGNSCLPTLSACSISTRALGVMLLPVSGVPSTPSPPGSTDRSGFIPERWPSPATASSERERERRSGRVGVGPGARRCGGTRRKSRSDGRARRGFALSTAATPGDARARPGDGLARSAGLARRRRRPKLVDRRGLVRRVASDGSKEARRVTHEIGGDRRRSPRPCAATGSQ